MKRATVMARLAGQRVEVQIRGGPRVPAETETDLPLGASVLVREVRPGVWRVAGR